MSCARAHVTWVIAILAVLLIGSWSFQLAEIPDLAAKLAIAASALSVTLAFLAIVYAFISNSQLSRSMGTVAGVAEGLTTSTSDLKSTSDQIRRDAEALPRVLDQIQRGTDERLKEIGDALRSASSKLGESVDRVTEVTTVMRTQAQVLPEQFAAFGGRLDAHMERTTQLLKERQAGPAPEAPAVGAEAQAAVPDELARRWVTRGSLSGVFLGVVLSEAFSRKLKKLDLAAIRNATGATLSDDYIWGYVVASNSLGIMDVVHEDDDNYEVNSVHPVLVAESRPRFLLVAERKEKRKDRYIGWLTKLDSYFASLHE